MHCPSRASQFEDTIRASGKGVDASLRGFALAFDAVSARRAQQAVVDAALAAAPAPDLRTLARQRLADYQDADYAALYEQRLQKLQAAEDAAADAPPAQRGAVVQEMVRWLALWMAFDDIVRVAAAKLAASRLARVQREVGLRDGELLKVYDHFKPGVPEFAALLPQGLARRLLDWDHRRVARGQRALGTAAEGGHAQPGRRAGAARRGGAEGPAPPRQPLCAGAAADRALAGRGGARHARTLGAGP